jgi:uncharacterized protein involved in response to NO
MALWHAGVALNPSLVTHALTVGAMTGLILAMMARVSLGHTGRPLQVPTSMVWAFALMQLATLARVVLPLFSSLGVSLSALCWCLALLLFCAIISPSCCSRGQTACRANGLAEMGQSLTSIACSRVDEFTYLHQALPLEAANSPFSSDP